MLGLKTRKGPSGMLERCLTSRGGGVDFLLALYSALYHFFYGGDSLPACGIQIIRQTGVCMISSF